MLESTTPNITLSGYISRLESMGITFSKDVFLAGGACRRAICGHNVEDGDFDIYLTNGARFTPQTGWLKGEVNHKWDLGISTFNYEIGGLKVQFHSLKGPAAPSGVESLLKTFDFTCCQIAYNGSSLLYVPNAIEDAEKLILRYTGVKGLFTAERAFRFQDMGFTATELTMRDLESIKMAALGKKLSTMGIYGRS